MNNNWPEWFVLIKYWASWGGTGYTLPFLVGARARWRKMINVTEDDARVLLDEIFNHPIKNFIIQIILCPNLGVPVFGLYKETIPGKLFKSTITDLPSVFVRQDLIYKWGSSVEDVFNGILDEVKQPIQEGLFSRTLSKTWTPFSKEELERIDRLLNNA